jgi:hypothetical protein
MVLRPLKYGVSTILTFKFSKLSNKDYDLKSTLYSEGTYITEGTMFLRPFLIPKGH